MLFFLVDFGLARYFRILAQQTVVLWAAADGVEYSIDITI
jgi:hypothetical protein